MKTVKYRFVVLALCILSLSVFAQSLTEDSDLANVDTVDAGLYDQNKTQFAISDPNYIVTAGDIYLLSFIANGNTVNYTIALDSTYNIKVANLSTIYVRGKKYTTVKQQVEDIVSKNYPMSGVQFSLQTPAAFYVIAKGEVKYTKEVKAWALTRLSSVVNQSKGGYSSLRRVDVTDVYGNTKQYDLYKALYEGDLSQNPYMRPGDVVTLYRYDRKVNIKGSVERSGSYELLPGENLKDLVLNYAHGTTISADLNRIEISKVAQKGEEKGKTVYLSQVDFENDYELSDLDIVYINSFSELRSVMFVEGAVKTSADSTKLDSSNRLHYQFNKDTNYAYFVQDHKQLFTYVSDIANAYIIRGDERIPLNIEKILYDSSFYCTEVLQPNDVLVVPFKQLFVTVSGSVYNPGRYPYIPDRTYDYYVGLAGGFIKAQNVGNAVKIKSADGKTMKKSEFITPESCIEAKTNSFNYYVSQHATLISVIATLISTFVSVWAIVK